MAGGAASPRCQIRLALLFPVFARDVSCGMVARPLLTSRWEGRPSDDARSLSEEVRLGGQPGAARGGRLAAREDGQHGRGGRDPPDTAGGDQRRAGIGARHPVRQSRRGQALPAHRPEAPAGGRGRCRGRGSPSSEDLLRPPRGAGRHVAARPARGRDRLRQASPVGRRHHRQVERPDPDLRDRRRGAGVEGPVRGADPRRAGSPAGAPSAWSPSSATRGARSTSASTPAAAERPLPSRRRTSASPPSRLPTRRRGRDRPTASARSPTTSTT